MPARLTRALAVFAAVTLCLVVVAPSLASGAGRGGQLTAILTPAGKSPQELLIVGAQGQVLRPISGWAGVLSGEQLAWSPDGKEFAYIAPGIDQPELMAVDADGSNRRGLPTNMEYGSAPLFGRGGDLIVPTEQGFASPPGAEPGSVVYGTALEAVPTDGSEPQPITSFGPWVRVSPYSIARDGTMAAVASRYPRGPGIATVAPGSNGLRWIVGPGTAKILDPAISPDGSRVIFLRDQVVDPDSIHPRLADTQVLTVSSSGGRTRLLATIHGGARWPSWDPSGARFSFTALALREGEGSFFPGTHSALMEMNGDGTCLTTVYAARNGDVVEGSAWRPGSGRAIRQISC